MRRAEPLPLTSCAVTWKSLARKSPDYPYVAEIDTRISESNTLREAVIVECRGRRAHLITATYGKYSQNHFC